MVSIYIVTSWSIELLEFNSRVIICKNDIEKELKVMSTEYKRLKKMPCIHLRSFVETLIFDLTSSCRNNYFYTDFGSILMEILHSNKFLPVIRRIDS